MSEIDLVTSKVTRRFSDIGRSNGTAPLLDTEDNRHAIVHELFVADHLRKLATKRYEAAKQEAVSCGVLTDQLTPGNHITYQGKYFVVGVRKNSPSKMLDEKKLRDNLVALIGADKTEQIIKSSQKDRAGATVIDVSAVG